MKNIALAICVSLLSACASNPNFYDVPPEWTSSAWVENEKVWFLPKKNAKFYPTLYGKPVQYVKNGQYIGVPYADSLQVRYEYQGGEGITRFDRDKHVTHAYRNARDVQRLVQK